MAAPETGPSPRELVAAAIKAARPGWAVDSYPNKPEQVSARRPYVDVFEVTRTFVKDDSQIEIDLEINCYSGKTVPAAAEDHIEEIRDDVLTILQAMPSILTEKAQRVVYLETYPGYTITAKQYGHNPYRPKE